MSGPVDLSSCRWKCGVLFFGCRDEARDVTSAEACVDEFCRSACVFIKQRSSGTVRERGRRRDERLSIERGFSLSGAGREEVPGRDHDHRILISCVTPRRRQVFHVIARVDFSTRGAFPPCSRCAVSHFKRMHLDAVCALFNCVRFILRDRRGL